MLLITLYGICCLSSCKQSHPVACSYWSNASEPSKAELQPRGYCAYEADGKIFVYQKALSELDFSKEGLAAIHTKPFGWLFVRRDGTTIRTVTNDNGPDSFSEERGRYVEDGKIGFIDLSGRVIVRAQYGFATPFKNGCSRVCDDFVRVKESEYEFIRSDRWGCIGRNGELLFPMKYSQQEMQGKLKQFQSAD